jgi:hypothetical protein
MMELAIPKLRIDSYFPTGCPAYVSDNQDVLIVTVRQEFFHA